MEDHHRGIGEGHTQGLGKESGDGSVHITIHAPANPNSNLALAAASEDSATQLAQMKREIAELEAQVAKQGSHPQGSVTILAFDISGFPFVAQFGITACGVLLCYLSFGVLQEGLIKHDLYDHRTQKYNLAWFLTLCQFVLYFIFAVVQRLYRAAPKRQTPFSYYAILGLLQVATMGISNLSVQFLNYPTHVIFKSAKPVPSLLFGSWYHHKKYSPSDWISVVLMAVGMVFFCAADVAVYTNFSVYGVVLVVIAIIADATSGAVQDKILTQFKAPQDEIILYTHLTGIVYLGIICMFGKELGEGVQDLINRPQIALKVLAFSLSGYIGASCLKALRKACGALLALLTSTTRKMATLGLSVLFFPKNFGMQYVLGAIVFFAGALLNSPAMKVRLRVVFGATSWAGKLLQAEPRRRRAVRLFK